MPLRLRKRSIALLPLLSTGVEVNYIWAEDPDAFSNIACKVIFMVALRGHMCNNIFMRFWTSDLHFSHPLMCRTRDYPTVEAHDEAIIQQWNKQVSEGDEVWILGDLTLKKLHQVEHLLARLSGTKKLVLGNHDVAHPLMRGWEGQWEKAQQHFSFVGTMATVRLEGETVLMSHFPYTADHTAEARYTQYRLPDEGNFLLHGHTHSSEKTSGSGSLHVGWDAWGRLVTESEVVKAVQAWKTAR